MLEFLNNFDKDENVLDYMKERSDYVEREILFSPSFHEFYKK